MELIRHRPRRFREIERHNMKYNTNITINNVRNANELNEFIPVEGQWHLDGFSEDRLRESVEQSVCNWLDAPYKIDVKVFTMNGHEIVNDLPAAGTFLATRAEL